jgi:hypothetical protein
VKAVQRRAAVTAEHEFEAQHGLPEPLPADERILWQGSPDPGLIAQRVFHLRLIAVYFAVMLAWRVATQVNDGGALGSAISGLWFPASIAATGLALVAWLARATARTTVYTLTDKRLVLRIGIVLTVSYNLPLRCIDAAHVLKLADGKAEIALALRPGTRLAYLHLWPHARPWHVAQPQPMLRCLSDGERVAARLAAAWGAMNAQAPQPARAFAQTTDLEDGTFNELRTTRSAA